MMDKTPSKAPDANQNPSTNKKPSSTRPQEQQQQQQQPLKCPRCDSPNTKFCYYNNYSLTQPRHFCKTCRRYWTKGGALRNVPIGGGCRKNKKIKSSSRLSADSKDSASSSSEIGGFKFLSGLTPPVDFQLSGLSPFPRLNQLSEFSNNPSSCFDLPGTSVNTLGFNYPLTNFNQEMGGPAAGNALNVNSNLASSIESLSSINQDLHWRLQQQRLALLFGDNNQKETCVSSNPLDNQTHKPQPILFQNLEISKPDLGQRKETSATPDTTATTTEWFFGNSFASVTTTTPSTNPGNETTHSWTNNAVQAWSSDLHQFSGLP